MFKNPQLVHIAVEITIFCAFLFWITSTNRRTNFFIKNLLQKVDELENKVLKLESYILQQTPSISAPPKLTTNTPKVVEKPVVAQSTVSFTSVVPEEHSEEPDECDFEARASESELPKVSPIDDLLFQQDLKEELAKIEEEQENIQVVSDEVEEIDTSNS